MQLRQRLDPLHLHPQFQTALRVIQTLQERGFATVFAGGCVRDSLLGEQPRDLDIATAASPDEVEKAFERTLAVGKAFGTIVVVEEQRNFEVTTFRKDGPYLDGRHPTHVEFSDMSEDAHRRDFTVNALFYDPAAATVYDFVGGVEDLKAEVLRTVGVAQERFKEDHLRMLRAARFVAQLGFALDPSALVAMRELRLFMDQVSVERVFSEVKRMLEGSHLVSGLRVMQQSHLSTVLWPELDRVDLERLQAFTPLLSWENAFAAIEITAIHENYLERLQQWKAPRESIRRIEAQHIGLKTLMNPKTTRAERALVLGTDVFAEILVLANGFLPGNEAIIEGWIEEFLAVTGEGGKLPKPWLNGQDLMREGIPPGEGMGLLLKALYMEQLEGTVADKNEALARLREIKV